MTTDHMTRRIELAANDLAKTQHAYRDLIERQHMLALDQAKADLEAARTEYHDQIVAAHNNGLSTRTIGAILNVSHQTIHNIIKAQRKVSA